MIRAFSREDRETSAVSLLVGPLLDVSCLVFDLVWVDPFRFLAFVGGLSGLSPHRFIYARPGPCISGLEFEAISAPFIKPDPLERVSWQGLQFEFRHCGKYRGLVWVFDQDQDQEVSAREMRIHGRWADSGVQW